MRRHVFVSLELLYSLGSYCPSCRQLAGRMPKQQAFLGTDLRPRGPLPTRPCLERKRGQAHSGRRVSLYPR